MKILLRIENMADQAEENKTESGSSLLNGSSMAEAVEDNVVDMGSATSEEAMETSDEAAAAAAGAGAAARIAAPSEEATAADGQATTASETSALTPTPTATAAPPEFDASKWEADERFKTLLQRTIEPRVAAELLTTLDSCTSPTAQKNNFCSIDKCAEQAIR